MKIKNLKNTPFKDIVECMLIAFDGYFVPMPSDIEYWRNRYKGARVDFELSFGVFDKEKLVAFIINGVGMNNGKLTAFNTGTGVLPDFRGKYLVDRMYSFALPFFRDFGIKKCQLEVIQENGRAVRVYERIGFEIKRRLNCFKGEIKDGLDEVEIKKIDFSKLAEIENYKHHFYSWDYTNDAILASGSVYEAYLFFNSKKQSIGHFVINKDSGKLAQLEAENDDFEGLMSGISQITRQVAVINVDTFRTGMIQNLEQFGIKNTINQFEMEMDITFANL